MAQKKGQMAKVEIDVSGTPTPVLELREWSISVSSEKIDASVAGDSWANHLIGRFSWEGEATTVWADEYFLSLITSKVTISFYDDEADVDPAYVGTASLDFERNTPYDDLIEASLTFTGAGELTHPVVI